MSGTKHKMGRVHVIVVEGNITKDGRWKGRPIGSRKNWMGCFGAQPIDKAREFYRQLMQTKQPNK